MKKVLSKHQRRPINLPQSGEDFDLWDTALLPEEFEDMLLKRIQRDKEQNANSDSTTPAADNSTKE